MEEIKAATYLQTLVVFSDGTEERLYTSDYLIQDKQFIVFDTRTQYGNLNGDILHESFTKVKMHLDNISYIRIFKEIKISNEEVGVVPDIRIKLKNLSFLDNGDVNCVYTHNPLLVISGRYDNTLIPFKNIISQEFFKEGLI